MAKGSSKVVCDAKLAGVKVIADGKVRKCQGMLAWGSAAKPLGRIPGCMG
jgi:hypothetical protein